MNRSRVTVASAIFIICCLLSSARLIFQAPTPGRWHDSSDAIQRLSDQRFAEIKKVLPTHGVVGYIGESGTSEALGAYYLTQYALAPVVVEHSANHALVIGNFPAASANPIPPLPENLRLVKNFGDGVFLLTSKESR
jgi:hypothetical protein